MISQFIKCTALIQIARLIEKNQVTHTFNASLSPSDSQVRIVSIDL